MSKRPLHIAVIGIDGSGKSSCYERLLYALSKNMSVAGIGDNVLVDAGTGELQVPQDILRVKIKGAFSFLARICKDKLLYEISKLTELILRAKIQDAIIEKYKPASVVTDGSALINILGWARYYRPRHFNEQEYSKSLGYLTGEKKLLFRDLFYYLKNIPEVVLINKVYSASLTVPDIIIFLKVSPEAALRRIASRGKESQAHEHGEFLRILQEAYIFICANIKKDFPCRVLEIDTDNLTEGQVHNLCMEFVGTAGIGKAEINIVATTISGSVKDWKKLDNMEDEFRRYYPQSKAHIVDSHQEAFSVTKDLICRGAKNIVSAGGAGTFNSVLEGCCAAGALSSDLRLAFLRKGSADLIGKVLKIPDILEPAVRIICDGIYKDKTIESDILEIETHDKDKEENRFHMIGFGGVGVFGDIPFFTESRFIKYYKGVLGYFFGDRGPFITGTSLAVLKRYWDKLKGRKIKFRVEADAIETPFKNYISIIVMNGDLGRHFPIAKGIPLNSGDFQVVLMHDRGLLNGLRQVICCWKGDLARHKERLGMEVFRTKALKIIPDYQGEYFLNVDGLLKKICGRIEYRIFSRVKLITG